MLWLTSNQTMTACPHQLSSTRVYLLQRLHVLLLLLMGVALLTMRISVLVMTWTAQMLPSSNSKVLSSRRRRRETLQQHWR